MWETAESIPEKVFAYSVDLALWFTVYLAEMSMPQSSVGQLWRAENAANRFIEHINYDTIKRGIAEARRRGLLRKGRKGRRAWPQITEAGKKRLTGALPQYDEKRVWDKRMHMITYDIPEKLRDDRDMLRAYLRRIGCGLFQDSVWITPYNPIDLVRSFITEQKLGGTIVVSDIGKDGSIGDEDLLELVTRIYKLEELNSRYEEWIREVRKTRVDHWMIMCYFSILQDDPQLPFNLLPKWWKGNNAYQMVKGKILLFDSRS
ncbi:hypothetical protein HY950_03630 [Candidatus Gottesmanbacteria bacterium]|nr:hypothetical protein [Candidatus Gottesmanbacteria bacterium]